MAALPILRQQALLLLLLLNLFYDLQVTVTVTTCFGFTPLPSLIRSRHTGNSASSYSFRHAATPSQTKIPGEYSIHEELDDDNDDESNYRNDTNDNDNASMNIESLSKDDFETRQGQQQGQRTRRKRRNALLVALEPGSPLLQVQIQLGDDMSLARKAWKKRRRNASPLLLPCSVLSVLSTKSCLQQNILYLLKKFGSNKGLSLAQLSQRYRSHLLQQSSSLPSISLRSLAQNALATASSTTTTTTDPSSSLLELLRALFPPGNVHGVEFFQQSTSTTMTSPSSSTTSTITASTSTTSTTEEQQYQQLWYIKAAGITSLSKARKQAAAAAIVQFEEVIGADEEEEDENDENGIVVDVEEGEAIRRGVPSKHDDEYRWLHTGLVRTKKVGSKNSNSSKNKMTNDDENSEEEKDEYDSGGKEGDYYYRLQRLSAALRVQPGSAAGLAVGSSAAAVVPAYVWDFDPQGDAGAPLLILSLNPPPSSSSSSSLYSQQSSAAVAMAGGGREVRNKAAGVVEQHLLSNLKVGKALSGTVVRLVRGAALVDVGAGRRLARHSQNDDDDHPLDPVLGRLPFDEAVTVQAAKEQHDDDRDDEDDDDAEADALLETVLAEMMEEDDADDDRESDSDVNASEEDITHLFQFENGVLKFQDPETGETRVIEMDENADEGAKQVQQQPMEQLPLIDNKDRRQRSSLSSRRKLSSDSSSLRKRPSSHNRATIRHRLHVGDRIAVYVKSVSKQSSQLVLTMNKNSQKPTNNNKKNPQQQQSAVSLLEEAALSPKKAATLSKKVSRLVQQLGGWDKLQELRGCECDGVVKAASAVGPWYYVKPTTATSTNLPTAVTSDTMMTATSIRSLPVGIAQFEQQQQQQEPQRRGDDVFQSGGASGSVVLPVLREGDAVRIRIEGVDPERGQLALKVLRKLSP